MAHMMKLMKVIVMKADSIIAKEYNYRNNGTIEEQSFTDNNWEKLLQELSYKPKMIFDF